MQAFGTYQCGVYSVAAPFILKSRVPSKLSRLFSRIPNFSPPTHKNRPNTHLSIPPPTPLVRFKSPSHWRALTHLGGSPISLPLGDGECVLIIPIGQSSQRRPTCVSKKELALVFLASERARANKPRRDLSVHHRISSLYVLQNGNTIPSYTGYARWFVGDRWEKDRDKWLLRRGATTDTLGWGSRLHYISCARGHVTKKGSSHLPAG